MSTAEQPFAVSRRGALKRLGSISFAALAATRFPRGLSADPQLCRTPTDAAMLVKGKNSALKVIEAKPLVLETPLAELARPGLTPAEMLFVRNNQDLPGSATLEPSADPNWMVEIRGLGALSRRITLAEIGKLAPHSVEMVLQCSGNSRYRFAETIAVKGTPWGDGGMGLVRFAGPKLARVLESLGIDPPAAARFITAGGADEPAAYKGDFEHSLPLSDVWERSILAVSLNDKPLPAIHGGPVRLVTPGYNGTMQVKWLTSLEFTSEESRSDSHAVRYRMPNVVVPPGSEYKYDLTTSRAGWKMPVKSVMLFDNALTQPAGKPYTAHGVALNDGACGIEAVLVSTNRGQSWTPAKLQPAESKYAWTRWTYEVEPRAGAIELWSRAIDELGRTQPIDGRLIWNPAGYEFNAVDKRVVMFG